MTKKYVHLLSLNIKLVSENPNLEDLTDKEFEDFKEIFKEMGQKLTKEKLKDIFQLEMMKIENYEEIRNEELN